MNPVERPRCSVCGCGRMTDPNTYSMPDFHPGNTNYLLLSRTSSIRIATLCDISCTPNNEERIGIKSLISQLGRGWKQIIMYMPVIESDVSTLLCCVCLANPCLSGLKKIKKIDTFNIYLPRNYQYISLIYTSQSNIHTFCKGRY
jgi:hypothetical protein